MLPQTQPRGGTTLNLLPLLPPLPPPLPGELARNLLRRRWGNRKTKGGGSSASHVRWPAHLGGPKNAVETNCTSVLASIGRNTTTTTGGSFRMNSSIDRCCCCSSSKAPPTNDDVTCRTASVAKIVAASATTAGWRKTTMPPWENWVGTTKTMPTRRATAIATTSGPRAVEGISTLHLRSLAGTTRPGLVGPTFRSRENNPRTGALHPKGAAAVVEARTTTASTMRCGCECTWRSPPTSPPAVHLSRKS